MPDGGSMASPDLWPSVSYAGHSMLSALWDSNPRPSAWQAVDADGAFAATGQPRPRERLRRRVPLGPGAQLRGQRLTRALPSQMLQTCCSSAGIA